jgi:hypothetical protein
VQIAAEDVALIERLVRNDRTAVSSALLAIAGIGAGEPARRAVLESVAAEACGAQAAGAISADRAAQIARHVQCARRLTAVPVTASEDGLRYEVNDHDCRDRHRAARAGAGAVVG